MLNLSPSLLFSRILTLIIPLTIHEFSHALVADHFGDVTARNAGRLTLNPLKHLDVFGSLMGVGVGKARAGQPLRAAPQVRVGADVGIAGRSRVQSASGYPRRAGAALSDGPLARICRGLHAPIPG